MANKRGKKQGERRLDGNPARKPGAPEHKPTAALKLKVQELSGLGLTHDQIAVSIGLKDPKTLRKHYADDLLLGKGKAHESVAGVLMKKAMEGDTRALEFYLSRQQGWTDKINLEHTGANGGAIEVEVNAGVENLLGALFGGSTLTQIAKDDDDGEENE